MTLGLSLALGYPDGVLDSTPGGSAITYAQPDGVFTYHRPDGSSLYLRP